MLNQDGFDVWAEHYDEAVRESDAAGTYPFAGYARLLTAVYMAAREGGARTVLDVGIGTGMLSGRLEKDGLAVTGLDFSEGMLAEARKRVPGANLIQYDMNDPLPEAVAGTRYDAIISTYALHHVDDAAKARLLTTLYGLLTPGGVLAVGDVSFETAEARDAVRQASGDAWDAAELYYAYAELAPLLPFESRYEQLSSCAGVLVARRG